MCKVPHLNACIVDDLTVGWHLRVAVMRCVPTRLLPLIISPVCSSGLAQSTRPRPHCWARTGASRPSLMVGCTHTSTSQPSSRQ